MGEGLLDHPRVFDAGDDLDGVGAALTGLIGYLPVPERFAAVYDRANRLSCRFVNVDVEDTGTVIDEIVVASGSGHTHAGLLCGLRALGSSIPVTGVCVRRDALAQHHRLQDHCRQIATLLDLDLRIDDADIHLMDDFLAPGHGCANTPTLEAITLCARLEGLLLDPVYTGKAMAGFIQRASSRSRC